MYLTTEYDELIVLDVNGTAVKYGGSDGLWGSYHELACAGQALYISSEWEGLFVLKDNPVGGDAFWNYTDANSDLLNTMHFDITLDDGDPNYLWIASVSYAGSGPGGVEKVFIGSTPGDSIFDQPTEIFYTGNSGLGSDDVRCVSSNGCDTWFGLVGIFDDGGVSLSSCNTIPSGVQEMQELSMEILPNPANSFFAVSGISSGTISIIDVLGKVVASLELYDNEVIDISAIPDGIYTIKLINSEGSKTTKLVIKK
jgi:hypothetical protein